MADNQVFSKNLIFGTLMQLVDNQFVSYFSVNLFQYETVAHHETRSLSDVSYFDESLNPSKKFTLFID
jgi:hypothetical protein